MRTLLLAGLALLLAVSASADKRALTIEDLYDIKNVLDPQFSPDGKRIAFTVSEYDLKEGKSYSDIWVMNADGSGQRQMTRHEKVSCPA